MRVLLVESDLATAQAVELMLKAEAMNVYTTDLAEEAIDLGQLYDYDIIVTELMLPDLSGFEVIRALRLAKIPTPIMVLTALSGVEDRVRALAMGADDFVPKPAHRDELVARIHAVVRRAKGHQQSRIVCGALVVDIGAQEAYVDEVPVHLTGKEYRLLECLALRKNTTVTKDMLLNQMYGGMDEPEMKIIDVFCCKVRKKLATAGAGGLIETVWGRGFVLREPRAVVADLGEVADLAAA